MAYEQERAERDFRNNPPQNAPGQGNDDEWGDLAIGSSSAESMDEATSVPDINSTLNSQPTVGQQQPAQQPNPYGASPWETIATEAAKASGKGLVKYGKFLVESLKNNTEKDWHDLGIQITIMSAAYMVLSLAIALYCGLSHKGKDSWDLLIGSCISVIPGLILMGTKSGKGDEIAEPKSADLGGLDSLGESNSDETYSIEDLLEDDDDIPEEEEYVEEYEECYDDEDSDGGTWETLLDDNWEEEVFEEDEDEGTSIESSDFDVSSEVDNIAEIQQGTQTRQYLFEVFMRVLPKVTPGFAYMNEIDEESDEFYRFETYLRGAAEQVGTKEENMPELQTVEENVFIYRLTCTRPVGLKEQQIADEVAKAYSVDGNNMVYRIGVYATVENSIGVYIINLFKGMLRDESKRKPIVISLGDVYKNCSDFILNTSVEMPFVWGVNEFGKAWLCDLKDNNSIIISGEPRGGKSWKGQSIVAQLCMYNSPKEIEFYIFDGKNNASDYRYLSTVLPHVRYFCGDQDRIVSGIESILNKAEKERGKILSDSGYINVKDYNKDHPLEKIPYMYIVVDEMMGLMEYFKNNDMKEEANKFSGLLSIMVSKLAYAGVRFILFPHRIVDSVISKNTYSLVSCRAVVCQPNMDALKAAVDVTKKTFPYDIVQVGDMALKTKEVENGKVVFCHAEILTSCNESNKKLFDYIGAVWSKLEPDCKPITINGSIGGSIGCNSINGNLDDLDAGTYKPPIDHTAGQTSYEYKGFDNSYNEEPDETMDLPEDLSEDDKEVDESFWSKYGVEKGW